MSANAGKLPKPRTTGTCMPAAGGELGQRLRPHAALQVQVQVRFGKCCEVAFGGHERTLLSRWCWRSARRATAPPTR